MNSIQFDTIRYIIRIFAHKEFRKKIHNEILFNDGSILIVRCKIILYLSDKRIAAGGKHRAVVINETARVNNGVVLSYIVNHSIACPLASTAARCINCSSLFFQCRN